MFRPCTLCMIFYIKIIYFHNKQEYSKIINKSFNTYSKSLMPIGGSNKIKFPFPSKLICCSFPTILTIIYIAQVAKYLNFVLTKSFKYFYSILNKISCYRWFSQMNNGSFFFLRIRCVKQMPYLMSFSSNWKTFFSFFISRAPMNY